ncbi:MAG: glycosyl transferase family 1 [Arcobacter sp.]|nr:MAG: glycosyl transferase family 1 [Arcobacter sp.]
MKILQFGRFYPPDMGGIQQVMYEISEGITKNGHQCDVLCSNTKAVYEESQFEKYTVYRTSSYGIVLSTSISPQLIYKFWKIHKKYDLIHVQAPDPLSFLALFLVRPKAKVVIHWHSDIVRQKKTLKYFMPLQTWVLKFASRIICTSEKYASSSPFLQKFKEKIEVIPLGISNKSFIANEDNVQVIQNRYKNKKIIFALGRLVSYKGFEYLVKSAQYLSDDFIILIGGTGIQKDNLLTIIKENNLQNKVELLGYLSEEEKNDYLEACFLFCLPSITKAEAFGVVIVEAMMFSKPIVSTNMQDSGVSWVNENNVTGLQVDPKSPKQLAIAFNKISNDKKLYEKMCKNSFHRYTKFFTREKMVTSLIHLFKSII